jgi:hypothetical protein
VIIYMLNFREVARERVMPFIKEHYLELVLNYEELYETNYCDKECAKQIRKYANRLVKKYSMDGYDKIFSYGKGDGKQNSKSLDVRYGKMK